MGPIIAPVAAIGYPQVTWSPCRTLRHAAQKPWAAVSTRAPIAGNWRIATCPNLDATRWLDTQRELPLPGAYVLVTFTLSEALRPLARSHQKLMYNLFFRTSSAAPQDLALAPPYLGGHLGMLGVLHTWTRDMAYHPHGHYLVPTAALAPHASRWLSPR
jgi:hypothetical protein